MIAASAQSLTTLLSFDGTDGREPNASLVQGTDVNFYGITFVGGSPTSCPLTPGIGCGTVFRMTAAGELTTLHSFCSRAKCADGGQPRGTLVEGANGNFYGTTQIGGLESQECGEGCGTVFEITPSGRLTTLYNFCSQTNCTDGMEPLVGLAAATNGNFYGTTAYGGANRSGTVFAITPAGSLSVLYSFCAQTSCLDGNFPSAALVQASNEKLYGSTQFGGTYNRGTIFEITTAGALTTLHIFNKGINPAPNTMIQGPDGILYGTTNVGGAARDGTVFRMTVAGKLTYMHSFCLSACTDGFRPAGLAQGSDGNFYGTTSGGGATSYGGTVFEITPTGTFTTLYNFCAQTGCPDGDGPGGLVQATNGNFYGITGAGGADNYGTAFSLSTGLGPFVAARPGFGPAGRVIAILGNNLTGTTSVTFNGTAAAFTVASGTLIKATVPAGATTGTIEVTTPSGTLSSNVAFQIVP